MVTSLSDAVETGKRLRQLRGIRTRSGVAREIGISYSALAFYERGERNPSWRVRKKLADYYGVPEEFIFSANEKHQK